MKKPNFKLKKKHSYIIPEFQLLIQVVSCALKNEKLPKQELNIEGRFFLELAAANNLIPFLCAHKFVLEDYEELHSALGKKNARIQKKNLTLKAELVKLIDLCALHKIDLICFKGAPVNEWIYGDRNNCRTSTDVDILIPPSQMPAIHQLLVEKGYKLHEPSFEIKKTQQPLFEKIDNQQDYVSPSASKIDVHFKMFKNPHILELPSNTNEYLIEEKFMGRKIFRLNNEYTLLFLILHGIQHTWSRMIWLIDIVKILQKGDEDMLRRSYALAEKNKVDHLFVASISLCETLFSIQIPDFIREKTRLKHAHIIVSSIKMMAGKNLSKWHHMQYSFFLKSDVRYFFHEVLSFPVRDFNIMHIPYGGRIFYPILRPLNYLLSKTKNS